MRDHEFDPYAEREETAKAAGEFADPEAARDVAATVNFLLDLRRFMDDVLDNPPEGVAGEWWLELSEAWAEVRVLGAQESPDALVEEVARRAPELVGHGLSGATLRSKLFAWRDRARAFLQLRSRPRLGQALRTGGVVLDSVAEAAGVAGGWKEVVMLFNHLVDLASQEAR